MRYLSFTTTGGPTWGVAVDGTAYDLGPTGADLAPTLGDAVRTGVFGTITESSARQAPATPESDIRYLPAVTDPAKIICIGVNYRTHQEETGKAQPSAPTIFFRYPDSQTGHLQPAVHPAVSSQFDYEGELALVIGRDAWRVAPEDAYDVVAGYGAYNDLSARDWQRSASQWGPGKNFPHTGAFGPYLVPATDIGDVTALHLQTRVNGDIRQDASLADLVFDIPAIISYVTTFTKLSAGDIIVTGTPGGVGLFSDPVALLGPGDVVEVEISGPGGLSLGTLSNTVVAEGLMVG
ncbi:fumarylacetoacetate hydrolase family protein [Sinomonas sp.]|uniref:fumarylacetoacetate hydrolase family protein n=1 Tax=Sinomonas sp. TaxID=1914986 RepID=UPI002C86DC63|nr:fumarylacetoacetate hydrolase family protein [Sinomonas sp.]